MTTRRTLSRAARLLAGGVLLGMLSAVAPAAENGRPWSLNGHVGMVSNYVSRGLTQTWGRPALQGELEIEHDSGFYTGAFASNVSNNLYPGSNLELDLWAGYEHELGRDFTLAAEGYYYLFPGANYNKGICPGFAVCPDQRFNTFVGRVEAGWRWLKARVGYSFGDYFGDSTRTGFDRNTRGTTYWELNAEYPLAAEKEWNLAAHLGYSHYRARFRATPTAAPENPSYWDWRLGVAKTFPDRYYGLRIGAWYTQASNRDYYDATPSLANGTTYDLGRPMVWLSIEKPF